MKVSPWESGGLVVQIRALSGTEVHLLDLKQRSLNRSLEGKKKKFPEPQQVQNIPNISDCWYRASSVDKKNYRASVFMILESHQGLHVCLTDKIPLMLHRISVFKSLDSQKLGTLNRVEWFSFLVRGFFPGTSPFSGMKKKELLGEGFAWKWVIKYK